MTDTTPVGNSPQVERLYTALYTRLAMFMDTEGPLSPQVVVTACGEFFAQVVAGYSVTNGETEAQLTKRLDTLVVALRKAVTHDANAQRQTQGEDSV